MKIPFVWHFWTYTPQSKGHILLVTKIPFGRIENVDDDSLVHTMRTAKKLILIMKKAFACDYVQIEIVGDSVPNHFHMHLIPRMNTDHLPEWPYQFYKGDIEKASYVQAIKNSL